MRTEILEVSAFLSIVAIYIFLRRHIAGKVFFILPAIFFCICWAFFSSRNNPEALLEFGIRLDNAIPAAELSALFFIPIAIATRVIAFKKSQIFRPPVSFYCLLILYLWIQLLTNDETVLHSEA